MNEHRVSPTDACSISSSPPPSPCLHRLPSHAAHLGPPTQVESPTGGDGAAVPRTGRRRDVRVLHPQVGVPLRVRRRRVRQGVHHLPHADTCESGESPSPSMRCAVLRFALLLLSTQCSRTQCHSRATSPSHATRAVPPPPAGRPHGPTHSRFPLPADGGRMVYDHEGCSRVL